MTDNDGRVPTGQASPSSPVPGLSPSGFDPSRAALLFYVAEDLIALAEYAYSDNTGLGDADIEDAYCDSDGVCNWGVCQESGCIINKYHRGLALQTAQAIEARSGETRETGLDPTDESAVPKGCVQGEVA